MTEKATGTIDQAEQIQTQLNQALQELDQIRNTRQVIPARIDDMKAQRFVAEPIKHFDHSATQDLFGAHPLGAGFAFYDFTLVQILQDAFGNGSVGIDDGADRLQLLTLGMIHDVGHQRHLFLPLFAHFLGASSSGFVVISGVLQLLIYYILRRNATAKCAFLCFPNKYDPKWTIVYMTDLLSSAMSRLEKING